MKVNSKDWEIKKKIIKEKIKSEKRLNPEEISLAIIMKLIKR